MHSAERVDRLGSRRLDEFLVRDLALQRLDLSVQLLDRAESLLVNLLALL